MKSMSNVEVELFDKQLEFIDYYDEREVLFEGGIGSGKTTVGALWLAEMALNNPKSKWLMVSRDHGQLEDATSAEFDFVLQEIMGLVKDLHYTKIKKPLQYVFFNKAIVNGRGAHNYDSAFRGPNYWGAWADEADFYKAEAIEKLRGRIRRGKEQIRYTSSPNGFNHIWEDFYNKKVGPVVHATSFDNPTLSDAYIESLRKTYSPRLFEQEVLAKRLQINVGAVYSEFKRETQVRPCRDMLEKGDELYFFTDYNISNYCGCYMIFKRGVIYVIGEEHLKFKKTKDMAEAVIAKFPEHDKIVVGDSTGNNKRDVAIDKANYAIFDEVGKGRGLSTKKFRNPPVQSRIINCNSRMHHNLVVIDPSCKNLIRDCELVAWKEDGSDIDKKDISLSHSSDAFGYGVWYFLPLRKQTKGKVSSYTKGKRT